MEMYKDVEIGGVKYQIGRMTARTGSWIAAQIISKVLPSVIESQMPLEGLPSSRSEMSEIEFQNIQDHCLNVCKKYELIGSTEAAVPVMARFGVFAVKDLEYDLLTVLALTIHALLFNISPFFEGDGLKSIMATFQGLSLFNPSV